MIAGWQTAASADERDKASRRNGAPDIAADRAMDAGQKILKDLQHRDIPFNRSSRTSLRAAEIAASDHLSPIDLASITASDLSAKEMQQLTRQVSLSADEMSRTKTAVEIDGLSSELVGIS